jgi:hypothetical protein
MVVFTSAQRYTGGGEKWRYHETVFEKFEVQMAGSETRTGAYAFDSVRDFPALY